LEAIAAQLSIILVANGTTKETKYIVQHKADTNMNNRVKKQIKGKTWVDIGLIATFTMVGIYNTARTQINNDRDDEMMSG